MFGTGVAPPFWAAPHVIEILEWEKVKFMKGRNFFGPFLVHKLLGPRSPPHHLLQAEAWFFRVSDMAARGPGNIIESLDTNILLSKSCRGSCFSSIPMDGGWPQVVV